MKSAYNNKSVVQKSSFNKGVDTAVDNYMLIAVSVLCDKFGFGGRVRIPKFVNELQERAENINQGYVTLEDIREQLYKEHKIILQQKRSDSKWQQNTSYSKSKEQTVPLTTS